MGGRKRLVKTGCSGRLPEDNMLINQIMLRFRPIAPRPVMAERTVSLVPFKEKRTKRKYVRQEKKKKLNDQTVAMLEVSNSGDFVTDPVRKLPARISFDVSGNRSDDIISRWITQERSTVDLHDRDLAVTMNRRQLVESWITVESVIGTCEDDGREIWKDLEMDTCPGFVSNCYDDQVQWVNLAYRRMVDPNPDGGAPPPEVVVWLGVKVERSSFEYWPVFSCRVRVVYLLSDNKKKMTVTVPCDVWKMDSGEYAWRLDVKAALSLGSFN